MTALPLAITSEEFTRVYLWLGVIVALGVLLGIAALYLRKRMMSRDEAPPMGFTLKDLRRMHAEGQLSDEELAAAEARTLARSRSHYLGDPDQATADESDPAGEPEESSTIDPPPEDAGAENPPDNPDKNGGGGSAA